MTCYQPAHGHTPGHAALCVTVTLTAEVKCLRLCCFLCGTGIPANQHAAAEQEQDTEWSLKEELSRSPRKANRRAGQTCRHAIRVMQHSPVSCCIQASQHQSSHRVTVQLTNTNTTHSMATFCQLNCCTVQQQIVLQRRLHLGTLCEQL